MREQESSGGDEPDILPGPGESRGKSETQQERQLRATQRAAQKKEATERQLKELLGPFGNAQVLDQLRTRQETIQLVFEIEAHLTQRLHEGVREGSRILKQNPSNPTHDGYAYLLLQRDVPMLSSVINLLVSARGPQVGFARFRRFLIRHGVK